jgi:aldehyde dehydrogenase (NAD+)
MLTFASCFRQKVCCAGSRLLVQESVQDEFVAKLKARMQMLRVGHSLDK